MTTNETPTAENETPTAEKPRYELTAQERDELLKRGTPSIVHTVSLLIEALGTAMDVDFVHGLVNQMTKPDGWIEEVKLNFLISVIKNVKPKDYLEAMLIAQMAVIHDNAMKFARRFSEVATLEQQDIAERTLNKFMRTYTMQMSTLKSYRAEGPQVTVQNVSVREGGQAIVGNVTRAAPDEAAASPPLLADQKMASMQTIDNKEAALVVQQQQNNEAGRSRT